jgi:hypothetical protein
MTMGYPSKAIMHDVSGELSAGAWMPTVAEVHQTLSKKRVASAVVTSVLHGKILVAHFLERRRNQPATGREELMPYPRRFSVHPLEPLFDHSGVLQGILPRHIIVDTFTVRTGFLTEFNQSGIQFRIRMRIQ